MAYCAPPGYQPQCNPQGGGMGYQGGNLPMMGGAPIYNPQIPYCDVIPGGMMAKRTIIIRGMVPYGANRCVCLSACDHLTFLFVPLSPALLPVSPGST
ncbi:galectin-4-like [Amia ocellicauda]|uniref:galectin-4-like n=1 Tax=Amia ocellicauda TaxID=2972642 RepID=UPI0034644188